MAALHGPAATAAAASAVGAFLTLLQPSGGSCSSSPGSLQLGAGVAVERTFQQQLHSHHSQCVLAAHKQRSLLAALTPLLPAQQHPPCSSQRWHQQPWQQLWPSQLRAFCSSSAALSGKAAWPNAVPSLHQPHKHSVGQPVRKPPPAGPLGSAGAAAADAARAAGAPHAAATETVWARHRVPIVMSMLFITAGTTLFVLIRALSLGASADYLRTNNPVAQKAALKYLRWWLGFRASFGESIVQQLVSHGIVQPLVGLVQPGTDALVLNEACEMMKSLLDSPAGLTAMREAGLQQRVDSGLLQGWVPTGALKAMKALQKALEQQQA